MKKLILLVCLFVGIGMSASVMAQTGINPYVGDEKTYSVTPNGASTFTWSLQSTALGNGSEILNVPVLGTPVATAASLTGPGLNSIAITWVNPTIDAIYYLHVTEDNAGCKNRKVIAIQPKNNFKLDIVNVDASGDALAGGNATDYSICPEDIPNTIAWNGVGNVTVGNATDFKYDYGSRTFYYKITATGLNFSTTTWIPSIAIAKVAGANATQTIQTKLGGAIGDGSWGTGPTLTVDATSTPTIAMGAGNSVIWVKITITNGNNTPALANENIVDNDFTITLNVASKDGNNKPATLVTTSTTQTQKARPNTGVIAAP